MEKLVYRLLFPVNIFILLFNLNTFSQIDPYRFIATLQYDGCDYFDSGESNFPMSFRFNTTQDANGDSVFDVEDNLENLVLYSISDSVYGTGRTGITGRGPNDQRPAIYFHFTTVSGYNVYEYWMYYSDNNWINDHEHDWEKYFVYTLDTIPFYILISSHESVSIIAWNDLSFDQNHPIIGIDGGSHAMKNSSEDGVTIKFNGTINKNNGTLITSDSIISPWIIYSDDSNVINSIPYIQSPDTFYYGDPSYLMNSDEWGDPRQAPWLRDEWDNPPYPGTSGLSSEDEQTIVNIYPNPATDILFIDHNETVNGNILIYSPDGSVIYIKNTSQRSSETIDISSFGKGIYFIKIITDKKTIIKKITVM